MGKKYKVRHVFARSPLSKKLRNVCRKSLIWSSSQHEEVLIFLTMTAGHEKLFKLIAKASIKAVARYLQEHPDSANAVAPSGWTPLMVACDNELFEIVRLLVDHGADVNFKAAQGWTPLHIAVDAAIDSDCKHKLGRRVDDAPVDIVVYLLWKGADPFSKTADGETPADLARNVTSTKLVHLLETYERALKSQTPQSKT